MLLSLYLALHLAFSLKKSRVILEKQLFIDCIGGVRMRIEKVGKYTIRWHGIKENGVLYSPEQIPESIKKNIQNVIWDVITPQIKEIPVNSGRR
jgi:basic membrane lipoprotein Med (substrate-binding protein (PBP1-ABC) superfamily)